MGIDYRSDVERGLTISVVDGLVTAEEFHAHAERQRNDPVWHTTTRLLTDARTAVTRAVGTDELSAFAALYAGMRSGELPFRNAIVAGVDFDLAGRYGDLRTDRSGSSTIAFNDLETACTWLGIEVSVARSVIGTLRNELRGAGRDVTTRDTT